MSSIPKLLIDFGDLEGTYEVSAYKGIENTFIDLVDHNQLSQISNDQSTAKTRPLYKIYDETSIPSNEVIDIIWLISQSHFHVSRLCSLK